MTHSISNSYVSVSVTEKIGYGLGDFASNLSFGFVSLFLLFYYTDIYGITAAQASIIFVVARIIDAIYNLAIGYLVDNTNSKHGKLRPYLLYGAIPLGLLTTLCFILINGEYKFTFALFSYTLYCLAYTTVNTPYSAMTNTITQNEQSRASLSVYRFTLASLGYLVVSTSATPLVASFSTQQIGYLSAVAIYSSIATIAFIACFYFTKERVSIEEKQDSLSFNDIKSIVFKNKPLINVSLYTLLFYIAYTVWMAIIIYYIQYVLDMPNFVTLFFLIQTAAYTTGVIVSEKLIIWFGKKNAALYGLLFGMAGLILQYFVAEDNIYLIMAFICMFSITLGIGFVTMWSMVPDTVEHAEWHHQVRAEGSIYGFYNFITKIGMALGGGCAGLMLELFEYSSEHITETAIMGINISITLFPAGLFLLCFLVVMFYELNEDTYRSLVIKIQQRKSQS
ncbi:MULTISPECIES: MFS transporter [unclassified Aeromonas]|uniref:MFS transporter n=1 Tax=unclassified Aeromonas TaxID=257493 RepID=UPI00084BC075|nr:MULTISPECIES: MFS transporter [unclassified Aeromonas]OEC49292.1 sugar transporter [Aeromonas sp. ANNP30]OEC66708.1 sugar transporter [Aeromonas sp. ANP5]